MQIYIARNSSQLGVFSPEEVTAGLSSGRFFLTDLAWREGMTNWTPLAEWLEFRTISTPATTVVETESQPILSLIPWEQRKSIASFFSTIKLAIVNPSSLSTGRFAFGDWFLFCYIAIGITLPFSILGSLLMRTSNIQEQFEELLRGMNHPMLTQIADEIAKNPPTPIALELVMIFIGIAFAPVFYAAYALAHWLGQRAFRIKATVQNTVSAMLLSVSTLLVSTAPLNLLYFNFTLILLASLLIWIPVCVIFYRSFGAATRVNPWAQFGISCLVYFVLCCCCCMLPTFIIQGIAQGLSRGLSP